MDETDALNHTQIKSIEEYKREFSKIEENFRTELSKCQKIALQLSASYSGTAQPLSVLKSQHEEYSKKINDYISKVFLYYF